MSGAHIVVFLSAGRCGTGWLASQLHDRYAQLEVEQAPIGALYQPRRYFRRYADPSAILEVPEVRRHVERLDRTTTAYVETGWPLLAALPLLAERFASRLRIVHITRHPVPTALLHHADGSYAGSRRRNPYSRLATLAPRDRNVFQPHYARTWAQLSAYEKCLFWWTEVNLFGLELPGRFGTIPLLRVQAEDVFSGEREPLGRLLAFMELPWHRGWQRRGALTLDRWPRPHDGVDPLEVHRHPATVETARELGYELAGLTRGTLEAHIAASPGPGPRGGRGTPV
jgi:hypothetical protein